MNSSCSWKAVGIGAVAGALAGLIPGIAAGAGLIGGGLGGALLAGALGGAVAGFVGESLSQLWDYGRIVSPRNIVVAGVVGAIVGAAFAGVGYGIGKAISGIGGGSANQTPVEPSSTGRAALDELYARSRQTQWDVREAPQGENPNDWFYRIAKEVGKHHDPALADEGALEGTIQGGGRIQLRPQAKSNPAIDTKDVPDYATNWKYHFPSGR